MAQDVLLDVAVSVFGTHGLEGASTRQIAREAGVAMSAITYHYGGKEGLYLAAADHIAQTLSAWLEADVAAANRIGESDQAGARDALQALFATLCDRLMSNETADHSRFIMREQMNPTAAFDHVYDGMLRPTFETMTRLVRIITGVSGRTAAITTMGLVGQAMSPRSSRASLLRQLGQERYGEETRRAILGCLAASLDAVLSGLQTLSEDSQPRRVAGCRELS